MSHQTRTWIQRLSTAVAAACTAATLGATAAPAAPAKPSKCPTKAGTVARGFGNVLWQRRGRLYGCYEGGPTISLGAWHAGDRASVAEGSAAWTTRKGKGDEVIDRVSAYQFDDLDPGPRAWLVHQATLPRTRTEPREVERVVSVKADDGAAIWVTASGVVGLALNHTERDFGPTIQALAPGDSAARRLQEQLSDELDATPPPAFTELRADGPAIRATTIAPADAATLGRALRIRTADDGGTDGCTASQVVSVVVPAGRSTPAVDVRWHRTFEGTYPEGC